MTKQHNLEQGLANYDVLAKSSPYLFFWTTVYWNGHTGSFTKCLWLLWRYDGKAEQLLQKCVAYKSIRYFLSGLLIEKVCQPLV